jgi:hypothetical protein
MNTIPHEERPPAPPPPHQSLLNLQSSVPLPEAKRRQALELLAEMFKSIVISERKDETHE